MAWHRAVRTNNRIKHLPPIAIIMFRFTIRDLLWLTVVAGLAAGWFVHVRALNDRFQRDINKNDDAFKRFLKEREMLKAENQLLKSRLP
jgi:hypothetical protein